MLQPFIHHLLPTLTRDINKYPALFAALLQIVGIALYTAIPIPLTLPGLLPLLMTPAILCISYKWKIFLFIAIGYMGIATTIGSGQSISQETQEYMLTFHTPPLYSSKDGVVQKATTPNTRIPVIVAISEPLIPGEKRLIIGSFRKEENRIDVKSTVSRTYSTRTTIYKNISRKIDRLKTPMKSYYYALFLRERYKVDPTVISIFEQSGLLHLMAISGLHILIFGSIIYYLLFLLPLPKHWHITISAIVSMCAVLIIGPSPSTNRALIMALSFATAPLFQRKRNNWNSLGIAALCTLFISPMDLFSAGFQLSFTATAAVLLTVNIVPKIRNRILTWGLFSITSTTLIFIFTAPILLWHFHQVVPASILFNSIPLLLLSITFSLMLFSLFISLLFPSLGQACMSFIAQCDQGILTVIQETILIGNFSPVKLLLASVEIAGFTLIIFSIALYISKRLSPTLLYLCISIGTSSIILSTKQSPSGAPYLHEIKEDSFLLLDLREMKSVKELTKDLQTKQLKKYHAIHIICNDQSEHAIRTMFTPYVLKKKVFFTILTDTSIERGKDCLTFGDTLQTPHGVYRLVQEEERSISFKLTNAEGKDCFSCKIEVPYPIGDL